MAGKDSDRIGLTPEVGGRSSRPNHALTDVVTSHPTPDTQSLSRKVRIGV